MGLSLSGSGTQKGKSPAKRSQSISDVDSPTAIEIEARQDLIINKSKYKPRYFLWFMALALLLFGHCGSSRLLVDEMFSNDSGYHTAQASLIFFVSIALAILIIISRLSAYYRLKNAEKRDREVRDSHEKACTLEPDVFYTIMPKPDLFRRDITLGWDAVTHREITVPDDMLVQHSAICGHSGGGKTSFMKAAAFQQILRGGALIYIDPKRRVDEISKMAFMAYRAGRLKDLRILDFGDIRKSHSYNMLYGSSSVSQLVERIRASMERTEHGSDQQFYREVINSALIDIIELFQATDRTFTLRDVQAFLNHPRKAADLIQQDLIAVNKRHCIDRLFDFSNKFRQGPQREEKFVEQIMALLAALRTILDDDYSDIFCGSSNSDINIEEVIQARQILYVALPLQEDTKFARDFMRIMMTHIMHVVGHQNAKGIMSGVGIPALAILDEYSSWADPETGAAIVQMGRSANISCWFGLQNLSKLRDRTMGLNDSFLNDMLGNTSNIISFGVKNQVDAEYLCGRWGKRPRANVQMSASRSSSISEERSSLPKRQLNPNQSKSEGLSEGFREGSDFILTPWVLSQGLKEVRGGKGRAVIETGYSRPVVADTVWIDPYVPAWFKYDNLQPAFIRPSGNPLALSERIRGVISDEARAHLKTSSTICDAVTTNTKDPDPETETVKKASQNNFKPSPGGEAKPRKEKPTGQERKKGKKNKQKKGELIKMAGNRAAQDHRPPPQANPNNNTAKDKPAAAEGGGSSMADKQPAVKTQAAATKNEQPAKKAAPPPWHSYNRDGLGAVRYLIGMRG